MIAEIAEAIIEYLDCVRAEVLSGRYINHQLLV